MAVDRFRSAADAAANDAESSYLRFALFGLYLAVVVGATTHEELLKGSVVTMPGLGVGLPIMGFYVLVPALFVLMHANLLLQLGLVAGHIRRLRAAIEKIASDEERELERALLPSSMISRFLFGGRQGSPFGLVLYLVFVVSLIVLPIGILIFVQIRFLPYHSASVTWWHRGLIFADLAVIWLLWPGIVSTSAAQPPPELKEAGPLPRRWGEAVRHSLAKAREEAQQRNSSTAVAVVGRLAAWARNEAARLPRRVRSNPGLFTTSLITVLFVSLIVTIPGSPAPVQASSGDPCEDEASADRPEPTAAEPASSPQEQTSQSCKRWQFWRYFERLQLSVSPPRTDYCLTYLLFEAPTTPLEMRRNLRVRNVKLVLTEPSAADVAKLGEKQAWDQIGRGLDLRGRDLRFADFSRSDLRKADLRGADLFGANLAFANLGHATAADVEVSEYDGCSEALRVAVSVDGNEKEFCRTRISHAILNNAKLQHVNFWKTSLDHASLKYAELERAALNEADLHGGDLDGARLQGANLFGARLDHASLKEARLDGANLSCAWARDTNLEAAHLSMAVLLKTRLDGANLKDARLEGAYLAKAHLSNTELAGSYLAGSDLRAAVLEGARLGSGPRERPFFHSASAQEQRGDRPFFGWANLRGVQGAPAYDQEALKEGLDKLWRRIAPAALAGAEPADATGSTKSLAELAYYDRIAILLTKRACDPGADSPELESLATRVLWDVNHDHAPEPREVTSFHKKVASSLLRPSDATEARSIAPQERPPDGSALGARDGAGAGLTCAHAAEVPQHIREGLHELLVTPLGASPRPGEP
jgi:uncharacterized protein YjbI with pentapeptide repeats